MRAEIFRVSGVTSGRLSTMARPRGGDWLGDEMNALRDAGVDVVVSMLMESEARELELATEPDAAQAAGLHFLALPTPDRGTPELEPFRRLVAELCEELGRGGHVVVHCRMGIGRASMVAAGVLMSQGLSGRSAWASVKEARGLEVPDTPEQKAWVEAAMALG